jgi:release factor glutamine methyltransferase
VTTNAPSLRQWLRAAVARLVEAGVDQADADAVWMACHVMAMARGELEARAATTDDPLEGLLVARLDELLARRCQREPLWHILGHAPFLGMELRVGPGVFSPRPETELIAHTAIIELLSMESPTGVLTVWDIGAGSGAIGLSIARGVTHAHVTCVEPSPEAHSYLERNIEQYGDGRVRLVKAAASEASDHVAPGSVDVVVSNPPYLIRESDWVDLETGNFDPDSALYADAGGLAVMADVVGFARVALRPGGVLVVEHGTTHNEPVAHLLTDHGFSLISHHNDLVGRPRMTRATKAHS